MVAQREGAGFEASEHDIAEQERDLIEEPFDPEEAVQVSPPPDETSLRADPADVHDQSIEVPDDEDTDEPEE